MLKEKHKINKAPKGNLVMTNDKNKKIGESLEEKLKKLVLKETKEDKKENEKSGEKKEIKKNESSKPKEAVIFSPNQKEKLENKIITLPEVKENLEESVLGSSTETKQEDPNKKPEEIKYSNDKPGKDKYHHTDPHYSSERQESGVKNIGRNIGREQNQANSSGLASNIRPNPLDPTHRDINQYSNSYSTDTQKYNEQDSIKSYEEAERQFYETSRRNVRDSPNKNI